MNVQSNTILLIQSLSTISAINIKMTLTIRKDLFHSDSQKIRSKNIQEYPTVTVTKKGVEMSSLKDISNMQRNKRERAKKATKVPAYDKENNDNKKYSNDMRDACRTICRICRVPVFLNIMRQHTRKTHKIPIDEYKKVHGNHRDMITEKVYHKCGICFGTILLDSDDIAHHLKKHHSISHKKYNEKHMLRKNKNSNIVKNIKDHMRKTDPEHVSKESKSISSKSVGHYGKKVEKNSNIQEKYQTISYTEEMHDDDEDRL